MAVRLMRETLDVTPLCSLFHVAVVGFATIPALSVGILLFGMDYIDHGA